MSEPNIGYIAESGFQHLFPILAMLPELPGPLFTTGKQIASRAQSLTKVIHVKKEEMSAALAEHNIDVVLSTSQRIEPSLLKSKHEKLRIAFINHGESHKTHSGGPKPTKAFVHSEVNNNFDLILVASKPHAANYQNPNKVNTGYLKHDLFVNGDYQTSHPHNDWILWAPTWGRHSSLKHWTTDVVRATKDLGLNLIIHPHPFSFSVEASVIQRLQIEVLRHKHVKIAQCANLLDAMAPCSLMLGDVSTSCFDWLMFDRPIVFMDHKQLVVDSERALFGVGDVIAPGDIKQLENVLTNNLANPKKDSEKRKKALNEHFFELDGHAARRVKNAVLHQWKTQWNKR